MPEMLLIQSAPQFLSTNYDVLAMMMIMMTRPAAISNCTFG